VPKTLAGNDPDPGRAMPAIRALALHRPLTLTAALLLAASLATFWHHAAPGLTFHDGGEFALAAASAGIPHPPGAPTWVILAAVFDRATAFADPVRSANLFSAVCGAATLALLAGLVGWWRRRTGPDTPDREVVTAALVAALVLAGSPAFASLALVAEQYTLLTMLLTGVLLLATRVVEGGETEGPSWRWALALGAVWGLAVGNHLSQLALLTVVAWAVIAAGRRRAIIARLALAAAGGFAFGALVYLWLPLRSPADPLIDWGDVETLPRLGWALTRGDWATRPLTEAPDGYLGAWLRSYEWPRQLGWPGLLLAMGGAVVLARQRSRWLGWLLLASVPYAVGILLANLRQVGMELAYVQQYGVTDWHLPLYLVAAAAAGFGAGAGIGVVGRRFGPIVARIVAAGIVALLATLALLAAHGASYRDDEQAARFANALVEPLPRHAVVAVNDSETAFVLGAARYLLDVREDLTITFPRRGFGAYAAAVPDERWPRDALAGFFANELSDPTQQPFRVRLPSLRQAVRTPLVVDYQRDYPRSAGRLLPVGLLFEVRPQGVTAAEVAAAADRSEAMLRGLLPDPAAPARSATRTAWHRLWLKRAEYFAVHGLWPHAARAADRSVAWRDDGAVAYYVHGFIHYQLGDLARAEPSLRRSLAIDPAVIGARTILAAIVLEAGHAEEAERLLREELRRQPGDADALALLRYLREQR
jgi:tetratricopeptide (TPR) repeat protein